MMLNKDDNRGISLIEVLITVALLMIVGAALVRLGIVAVTNSDASRIRTVALQLADEGLEIARSVRDQDATTFFSYTGNKAVNSSSNGLINTNCDPTVQPFTPATTNPCEISIPVSGTNISFYRIVRITNTTGVTNSKDVTSYVYWNNKGSYSNVSTSTILSRWRG